MKTELELLLAVERVLGNLIIDCGFDLGSQEYETWQNLNEYIDKLRGEK